MEILTFNQFSEHLGDLAKPTINEDAVWFAESTFLTQESETTSRLPFRGSSCRTFRAENVKISDGIFPLRDGYVLAEGMHHNFARKINQVSLDAGSSDGESIKAKDFPIFIGGNTNNFWHFIYNFLLRINLDARNDSSKRFVIIDKLYYDFEDIFDLLGISKDRLIRIPAAGIIKFETLTIVESPFYFSEKSACGNRPCGAVLSSISTRRERRDRRIYISRQDAGWRRVINEDAVEQMLGPLGFETITLKGMPLAEIAACMSEAEIVIGASGANLAATAFCKPRTKVVELGCQPMIGKYYFQGSSAVGGFDHYKIEAVAEQIGPKFERWDFTVPMETLGKVLSTKLCIQ